MRSSNISRLYGNIWLLHAFFHLLTQNFNNCMNSMEVKPRGTLRGRSMSLLAEREKDDKSKKNKAGEGEKGVVGET